MCFPALQIMFLFFQMYKRLLSSKELLPITHTHLYLKNPFVYTYIKTFKILELRERKQSSKLSSDREVWTLTTAVPSTGIPLWPRLSMLTSDNQEECTTGITAKHYSFARPLDHKIIIIKVFEQKIWKPAWNKKLITPT